MQVELHAWKSPNLGQKMELKVYGHYGKPLVVIPTSGGRFFEYEDFGMIEAIRPSIERGKVKVFALDSVDRQSWLDLALPPKERAKRHEAYDRYVLQEVLPFIYDHCRGHHPAAITGCSLGAFHAANFFFRHPTAFDTVIALSGVYSTRFSTEPLSTEIYLNSPLDYLPRLHDPRYLEAYRQGKIVFCVGLGAWEDRMIRDTRRMQSILQTKGIPAWIDFWGHDVEHHWFWWRKQMPYFLQNLLP